MRLNLIAGMRLSYRKQEAGVVGNVLAACLVRILRAAAAVLFVGISLIWEGEADWGLILGLGMYTVLPNA